MKEGRDQQRRKSKSKSKNHQEAGHKTAKFNETNSFADSSYNSTVSRTTSKPRTPLPPNQTKKVNNKRAAKRKREKLLELSRKTDGMTPLSDSSTTRQMLDGMNLKNDDGSDINNLDHVEDLDFQSSDVEMGSDSEDFNSSDSENLFKGAKGEYKDLPCDALILNTETVERIIEQIETDIEDEVEGPNGDDSNNFDDEEEEEAKNEGVQRYFLENSGPKCFNCGESGHMVKDCPATSTVPCNLCGQLGHMRMNCPQELCYNCSRPGHQSKACPARRKRRVFDDEYCNRCGQPGHLARECSLAWRGYVFSRDLPRSHSAFLDELRRLRKRCYNCASISHFGDDCPTRRRPNYSVFHIPDYDYLDRVILRIRRDGGNNSSNSNNKNFISTYNNNSSNSTNSTTMNAKQKQADNFNKIVNTKHEGQKSSNKINSNNNNNNNNNNNQKQKKIHHNHLQNEHNDSSNDHLSNAKNENRKVFLQSRGIEDDDEKPVPFVRYEDKRIVVNLVDDDGGEGEGNFRKGSSSHKSSGPKYRGGYK